MFAIVSMRACSLSNKGVVTWCSVAREYVYIITVTISLQRIVHLVLLLLCMQRQTSGKCFMYS